MTRDERIKELLYDISRTKDYTEIDRLLRNYSSPDGYELLNEGSISAEDAADEDTMDKFQTDLEQSFTSIPDLLKISFYKEKE